MRGDPRIRASDADRDRVATLLREHHAAGRLTAEEFHERMEQALDAKTLGELDGLLADLPAIDLYRLPDQSLKRHRPTPGHSSALAAIEDNASTLVANPPTTTRRSIIRLTPLPTAPISYDIHPAKTT